MKVEESKRPKINSILLENFKELALNANGICVLKKFISTIKSETNKEEIYKKILKDVLEIIKNPFGNYIVQMIVEVIFFIFLYF